MSGLLGKQSEIILFLFILDSLPEFGLTIKIIFYF
ncbi:MAG: hypothetical protein CM15mP50_2140 [Rhodobacterales bacterium]|nr:MAG: hypothetical protein CM15mP50_2140 [Rhodobacterales bacterium]